MIDEIDAATGRAVWFHADAATERYYELLALGRVATTRCDACAHAPFPPREFCPACGGEKVTWIDIPKEGVLYAFTYQSRGFRFVKPDVIGLVQLDGIIGFMLARIAGSMDDLAIGCRVKLDIHVIDDRLRVPIFERV
jgi:hypothetical protein